MPDLEAIKNICLVSGIPLLGEPILDGDQHAFLNVSFRWDSRGRRTPSHQLLARAEKAITALGVSPKFLLYSDELVDLESGLRATLLTAHPNLIRNVFASVQERSVVDVWLEARSTGAREESALITKTVERYFEPAGIRLGHVSWLKEANTPSKLATLSSIRRLAPVKLESLKSNLTEMGFEVPSDNWLLRNLDRYRKAGGIVRTGRGEYVLTYSSLMQLGTTKDSNSPDIVRLLAIAKACA